jgi:hypothetical protein
MVYSSKYVDISRKILTGVFFATVISLIGTLGYIINQTDIVQADATEKQATGYNSML